MFIVSKFTLQVDYPWFFLSVSFIVAFSVTPDSGRNLDPCFKEPFLSYFLRCMGEITVKSELIFTLMFANITFFSWVLLIDFMSIQKREKAIFEHLPLRVQLNYSWIILIFKFLVDRKKWRVNVYSFGFSYFYFVQSTNYNILA